MPHEPEAGETDPGLDSPLDVDLGCPGPGPRPSALGQALANHLFAAGLDLQFALMVVGDGAAAPRLRHAVDEIDQAIKDLRILMLAIPGQGAASGDGDGSSTEP